MIGEIIFVAVVCFIAGAAGWHLYQSKFVKKPGVGKTETGENGVETEVEDNPKEKTIRK